MELLAQEAHHSNNPIDIMEELVSANDWVHDRSSDWELVVMVAGHWCDYHLCCVFQPELGALTFACTIDAKVPPLRRAALHELLVTANEKLWMGHFDLAPEDGSVVFRHTVPLRGTTGMSVEQIEDMMDAALSESERLFPALQMVIWGGHKVSEAVTAAMMETVGEA